MKRALLIAGGTVGGLGAVLSITPPQLGAHSALGGGLLNTAGAATKTTPIASTTTTQPANTPIANTPAATTPVANTTTATPLKAVVKKKHKTTKRQVAAGTTNTKSNPPSSSKPVASTPIASTPTPTQATPTPVKSTPPATTATPTPVSKKVSGTFVGSSVPVNYGNVQVQITVSNGKITDAQALQSPQGGRSGSISSQAIPMLRQQTLAAQSSAIQGVGGASYTSYGWYTSLQSALTKAGLPL